MRFLKSPFMIMFSLLAGIFFGILADRSVILVAGFLGQLYLKFVQMTVIPVLVSAVVSSLAKLIRYPNFKNILLRMMVVFTSLLMFYSVIGLVASLIIQPGTIDVKQQAILGEIIKESKNKTDLEVSLSSVAVEEESGFLRFLSTLVPSNIFESLALGRTLELVFFSIIFGIAVGFGKGRQSDFLISFVNNFFLTFQKIIEWAMLFLPFGLFCLVAKQVSDAGVDILISMMRFLSMFIGLSLILIIFNTILIWRRTPYTLWYTFKGLLEPVIIALTTRSSLASIPASIEALSERLRFDRITTNLIIPMGVTLCRYGNVLYFSIAGIFVAQIYNIQFEWINLITYPITVVLAAVATAGATGFATLSMLGIVLTPLGLPLEAVLIVFYAIDPIIDPFRSLLIVHTNITATALLAPRYDGYRKKSDENSQEVSNEDDLEIKAMGIGETEANESMQERHSLYDIQKQIKRPQ